MTTPAKDKYEPPHASLSYGAIEVIEGALDVKLPEQYKQALLHNPFKGTEMDESFFWNNTDQIIARNLVNRKIDWFGRPWPENGFQIGDSCDQGAVFLELSNTNTAVYFYHWEMEDDLKIDSKFKISDRIADFFEKWSLQEQY